MRRQLGMAMLIAGIVLFIAGLIASVVVPRAEGQAEYVKVKTMTFQVPASEPALAVIQCGAERRATGGGYHVPDDGSVRVTRALPTQDEQAFMLYVTNTTAAPAEVTGYVSCILAP